MDECYWRRGLIWNHSHGVGWFRVGCRDSGLGLEELMILSRNFMNNIPEVLGPLLKLTWQSHA